MREFIEYLDGAMPDQKGNRMIFEFKRDLLTKMNERYLEIANRGVDNKKAFCDLIISEHTDLDKEYNEYCISRTAESRRKRRLIANTVGSIAFIALLIISYLAVSFITQDWAHTWVMVVDGILLWVTYLLTIGMLGISKLKRIYWIFARILLAIAVVVFSVAVFIFCMAIVHVTSAWTIVIGGIIAMFVADLIYISVTKHKLAIVNYLIYIPVIFAMLFIIVCDLGLLAWNVGWWLIVAGVGVDFIIVIGELMESKHFEKEMKKNWQEN